MSTTLGQVYSRSRRQLNNNFNEFEIFEAIRSKQKGGTAIGAHKSLDPILIEEFSEKFELLVVEVSIGGKDVRVRTGYGPQENWKREEIVKGKSSEKLVYIQMDANSKLGPAMMKGDTHAQSDNGKILTAILKQNALFVVNN